MCSHEVRRERATVERSLMAGLSWIELLTPRHTIGSRLSLRRTPSQKHDTHNPLTLSLRYCDDIKALYQRHFLLASPYMKESGP